MWLRLFVTLACAGMSSCATKAPNYDSNATESLGRIIKKSVVDSRTQSRADQAGTSGMAGVIGYVGTTIASELFVKKTQIEIFEYRIRVSDGREVIVLSDYFANEVGDCVKVLESQMPSYPRFVSANDCQK